MTNQKTPEAIYNTFDRVVCFNLDRRKDRRKEFTAAFSNCDWPFKSPEIISAIDGTKVPSPSHWRQGNGAWGCYRSHLRIIEECLNQGVNSVLLLEDDAFPIRGSETR